MKYFLSLAAILLSLTSCVFVAGAAAGAAGIAVVYDHRKVEQILVDKQLANTIEDQISAIPDLAHKHIEVIAYNRVVLLLGEAPTDALRLEAGEIAKNVSGVSKVYNQISIKGPISSLTRASDTWITTKIKTQMLAEKGLKSGSIKVVTENGTVYLMGIVSKRQAEMAVTIARRVTGVQKVIKIFQYKEAPSTQDT